MRSGHAAEFSLPVIAAGLGVRRGSGWAVRSASFRLGPPGLAAAIAAGIGGLERLDPATPAPGVLGPSTLGVATLDLTATGTGAGRHSVRYRLAARRAAGEASRALSDVLAGRAPPGYGSLTVLGEDMSDPAGRAVVRRQAGLARASGLTFPAQRIRRLVERAAWISRQPGWDGSLLAAAILDRLALTPWADVPLHTAPPLIARKARLAAAMVHEPRLLVLDRLLDDLTRADQAALARLIAELARDTPVIAIGRDPEPLRQACAVVLDLRDGVLAAAAAVSGYQSGQAAAGLQVPAISG